MTAALTYDGWKTGEPAPVETPAPDPHDACERDIAALQEHVAELERTLRGYREGRAVTIGYRPVPPCKTCADGRPNSDCTCRGTGAHMECDGVNCGTERTHGHCLEATITGRRALLFCSWWCAGRSLREEMPPPAPCPPPAPHEDDIPW